VDSCVKGHLIGRQVNVVVGVKSDVEHVDNQMVGLGLQGRVNEHANVANLDVSKWWVRKQR
jgi:hypothetical protein